MRVTEGLSPAPRRGCVTRLPNVIDRVCGPMGPRDEPENDEGRGGATASNPKVLTP